MVRFGNWLSSVVKCLHINGDKEYLLYADDEHRVWGMYGADSVGHSNMRVCIKTNYLSTGTT
jgi:hypothetical protein